MKTYFEYVKRHPMRSRVAAFIFLFLVISIILTSVFLTIYNIDIQTKVDSAIVNGVLTSTAIVFGFLTFEIREIKLPIVKKFYLHLVLLFSLFFVIIRYFDDSMRYEFVTKATMAVATVVFVFSIFYSVLIMILKEYYDQEVSGAV